jgi:enamine deaminase RidA (YjgF/YER057c/UK114 family)
MSDPEARLSNLGLALPKPAAPAANYVPFARAGDMLYLAGQVSLDAAGGVRGVVGADVSADEARRAAQLCALNLIAQMKAALDGDLRRVRRIVKVVGFVQAGPDFFAIPQVVNGASDLLVEVFGEAGRHARSAVGVYRLPLNFAVEVEAVVEVA